MEKLFIQFFAKYFGRIAHNYIRQVRKYSGDPYYTHTERVHDIVMLHGGNAYQGAAAYLHDYREDVVTLLKFQQRWFALFVFESLYWTLFPTRVHELVTELTDVYTSEDYPVKQNPVWNRKWRKEMEAKRISQISDEAKTIKLADLFDNTESIVNDDADFAITYLKEKHHIMKGLWGGNHDLFVIVKKQLQENIDKLKVIV